MKRTMGRMLALCALALLGIVGISVAAPPARRDTVDGRHSHMNQAIADGNSVRYEAAFWGEEWAGILVLADGDVDVIVYDEAGNVVASDLLPDAFTFCFWWPEEAQVYTIEIINNEHREVHFDMTTN